MLNGLAVRAAKGCLYLNLTSVESEILFPGHERQDLPAKTSPIFLYYYIPISQACTQTLKSAALIVSLTLATIRL